MIKPQRSCASFIKRKYCSKEDIVSLKWLLIPEQIDYTVLKLMFKGILKGRMVSNLQINIKNNKSTKTLQLILINDPNYSSHFHKYATKLYHKKNFDQSWQLLKKCLFDKTLYIHCQTLLKKCYRNKKKFFSWKYKTKTDITFCHLLANFLSVFLYIVYVTPSLEKNCFCA